MGLFSKKTADYYVKKAMDKFARPQHNKLVAYRDVMDLLYKAEKLEPDNADIHFLSGWVNNHHNYYEYAIRDTDKAIELNPNYADAYYNRGYAKFEMQNYDGALADFDKAIELKPDFPEAIKDRETLLDKMNI